MSAVVYHSELIIEELWNRLDREAWTWEERQNHWNDYGYFYKKLSQTSVRIAWSAETTAPAVDVVLKSEENGTELSISGYVPAIYTGTIIVSLLGLLVAFLYGTVIGVISLPMFLIPMIIIMRKVRTFECPDQEVLEIIQIHLLTRRSATDSILFGVVHRED